MAAKPSIPKGTRDFSPVEMAKRNYRNVSAGAPLHSVVCPPPHS